VELKADDGDSSVVDPLQTTGLCHWEIRSDTSSD